MKKKSDAKKASTPKPAPFDIEACFNSLAAARASEPPIVAPITPRPSVRRLIESYLKAALGEQPDQHARDEFGQEITAERAAHELYHLLRSAGHAVALIAQKKPEALRGIARKHWDTFVPYDAITRRVDTEGWRKLIELGKDFKLSHREARSDTSPIIASTAREAFQELMFWRDLRELRGKDPLEPEFESEAAFKVSLALPLEREEGESDHSYAMRRSLAPEFSLRAAAKRLPPPKRKGVNLDIWTAAIMQWVMVKHGGKQWHQSTKFDGINASKDRKGHLRKLILSHFESLLAD